MALAVVEGGLSKRRAGRADRGVALRRQRLTGRPLDHLLYHLRLVWSGVEHAHVILRDDGTEGIKRALCRLIAGAASVDVPAQTEVLTIPVRFARRVTFVTTPTWQGCNPILNMAAAAASPSQNKRRELDISTPPTSNRSSPVEFREVELHTPNVPERQHTPDDFLWQGVVTPDQADEQRSTHLEARLLSNLGFEATETLCGTSAFYRERLRHEFERRAQAHIAEVEGLGYLTSAHVGQIRKLNRQLNLSEMEADYPAMSYLRFALGAERNLVWAASGSVTADQPYDCALAEACRDPTPDQGPFYDSYGRLTSISDRLAVIRTLAGEYREVRAPEGWTILRRPVAAQQTFGSLIDRPFIALVRHYRIDRIGVLIQGPNETVANVIETPLIGNDGSIAICSPNGRFVSVAERQQADARNESHTIRLYDTETKQEYEDAVRLNLSEAAELTAGDDGTIYILDESQCVTLRLPLSTDQRRLDIQSETITASEAPRHLPTPGGRVLLADIYGGRTSGTIILERGDRKVELRNEDRKFGKVRSLAIAPLAILAAILYSDGRINVYSLAHLKPRVAPRLGNERTGPAVPSAPLIFSAQPPVREIYVAQSVAFGNRPDVLHVQMSLRRRIERAEGKLRTGDHSPECENILSRLLHNQRAALGLGQWEPGQRLLQTGPESPRMPKYIERRFKLLTPQHV